MGENKEVIAFDFDGTCTVETEEGRQAFMGAYIVDFTAMLNEYVEINVERVRRLIADARVRIEQDPSKYGWIIDGKIVAPALVDVFVEAQVCAQVVLADMGKSLSDWDKRLNALCQQHYLKCKMVFRPELLDVLRELRDNDDPFYIITNSDPAKVQKRLEELGDDAEWIKPCVRGFAKKFVVTEGPDCVPKSILFPGLERPIYLRKRNYFDILETIRSENGAEWEDVTIVGDIAELDLALPVELGAFCMLIVGPNTPSYEATWINQRPNAFTVESLQEIPL